MKPLQAATVRVPGSTSNLGPGFDTLGLAVDRYLEARFEPGQGSGLQVERSGTLHDLDLDPEEDLLVQALRAGVEAGTGGALTGRLSVTSEIPVARGLGSSAAAMVAGWLLAQAIQGEKPDREGAFRTAAAREGHGDNAAPCAFGGLQAVVDTGAGTRATTLPLHEKVGLAYAAPALRVSTRSAREVLPRQIDHRTAVAGLGRLAALLQGLATADETLIRVGVRDELHVPYRLPLIPGARDAISAGYDAGAWGVTISGSGSGFIAFGPRDRSETIARVLLAHLSQDEEPGGVAFACTPDLRGGRLLPD